MGHDRERIDFSVVIPTFRRNRELAEAIASVQRQQGVTLEILVVDDCSTGGARTVVEALNDPRVTYLQNPTPTGGVPSVVRNLAWPGASGSFVHFLDDDDLVPDGHYAASRRRLPIIRKSVSCLVGSNHLVPARKRNYSTNGNSSRGRRGARCCASGLAVNVRSPVRCCSICRCWSAARRWCGANASPASAASIPIFA